MLINLRRLELQGNRLEGPIPGELGALSSLESLWLSWNRLSGEFPSELGALAALRNLYIQGNPLLSGCVPENLMDSLASHNLGELEFCEA